MIKRILVVKFLNYLFNSKYMNIMHYKKILNLIVFYLAYVVNKYESKLIIKILLIKIKFK